MSLLILAFGSNLGDRAAHIERALRLLDGRAGRLIQAARPIETAPEGFVSEHAFLNSAATFETELSPEEILKITREIEQLEGRTHKSVNGRYADRPLDIDIIALGDTVMTTDALTLPHPEAHKRRFVLEPVVAVAPDAVHPVLGLSYAALLRRLDRHGVRKAAKEDINERTLATVNELLSLLSEHARTLSLVDLGRIIENEETTLLFALDETDAVCGMTTVARCVLPTGTKAWVEDVVVLPAQRGKGYGRALLEAAREEAERLGADSINLTSRPARREANALYRSLGYEQRETNVYRRKLK